MASRQVFNPRTQQCETAELTRDRNDELIATFTDGGFVKFPAHLNSEQFTALIEAHERANRRGHHEA